MRGRSRVRAAHGLVAVGLGLAACSLGCSKRIEVLAPVAATARDAAATRDAATRRDASSAAATCEGCGAQQLCAVDRCVDLNAVSALASWLAHSCEVAKGRLDCWGANADGQLGLGDQAAHPGRARVGSLNDWLAVATGEHHSCGLRAPGTLYCWGGNGAGQLGTGDTNPRLSPAAASGTRGFRRLACGGDSCCAIDVSGALFCWGDNLEGKLGLGDVQGAPDGLAPAIVPGGFLWREVAVGQGHVCAARDDGALYCWGRNTEYELGLGTTDPVQLRTPTRVGSDSDWQKLACSQHHCCGVRDNGGLYCWGGNQFFELAIESNSFAAQPTRVGDDTDWADVGAGWFHSCALRRDGRLYCFGRAIEGQLGLGMGAGLDPIAMPSLVSTPSTWQAIALGNFFTCGLDATRALYCWGKNDSDELGLNDSMRRYAPVVVP